MSSKCEQISFLVILLLLSMLHYGCSKYVLEEESPASVKDCRVGFSLSTPNIQMNYPAHVYVFQGNKTLFTSFPVKSAQSTLQCTLPKGKYSAAIYADLAGEYTLPQPIAADALLHQADKNYSKVPLVGGFSRFEAKENAEVTLKVKQLTAQFNLKITHVPLSATGVSVRISSVGTGISFEGKYDDNPAPAIIPLSPHNQVWSNDACYVFPSGKEQIEISFIISFPEGEKSFSYALTSPLKASGQYQLTGEYISDADKDKIVIEGLFGIDGWQEAVNAEVPLIDSDQPINPDDNNDTSDTCRIDTIYTTGQLPVAESIWGHQFFVWKVTPIHHNELLATLISLRQGFEQVDQALYSLHSLNIDGITGWHFFTIEEARQLKQQYNYIELRKLNQFFLENDAPLFKNDEQRSERYFCDDGKKSFAFYSDRITAIGHSKKYYWRGVKNVRIIRQ